MSPLDLVIIALATLYVSVVLSNDNITGPYNILTTLRLRLGVNWVNGFVETRPGSIGDMIMCPYCNSPWVAILLVAAYGLALASGWPASWLFAPLACAGFVVLVQELKKI